MSEIKVPAMGESITEGTVSRWLVKEGETVNQGDVLLELETDKVNIEISAEESGVLEKLFVRKARPLKSEKRLVHWEQEQEEEAEHPLPSRLQNSNRLRPQLQKQWQ